MSILSRVGVDEAEIREVLKTVRPPSGVSLRGVQPYYDHAGEPAVRVTFEVSRDKITEERLEELNRLDDQVLHAVQTITEDVFPYVSFVDAG